MTTKDDAMTQDNNNDQAHDKDQTQDRPLSVLSRRSLLKAGGAATLAGALMATSASAADGDGADDFEGVNSIGQKRESYWREDGKYFVQENVDTTQLDSTGVIRARIEGQWHDFVIRELDDAFINYNIAMRKKMLGMTQLSMYNDAHNAAVASYGGNRGDSYFTLNVAFKGMGWIPKADKIDERTQLYSDNYKASNMAKAQELLAGYNDPDLWDRTMQGSLELYTEMNNETHTFLNQMVNPVSTICFLAMESYELRVIARLLHPADPNLTAREQQLVKWMNFAHDFYHGGPNPMQLIVHNIGVVYYVVEEFDNSPYGMTATAGGMKRVPIG